MRIKIITDSTADLPREIIERYQIEILPLIVNFDEDSYVDGMEITPSEFYEKMRNSKNLPTTSQVPIKTIQDSFESNLKAYDFILAIFLSSKMSGTYQTASLIARDLGSDKIHLIDSGQVTLSLGLVVLEAARLVEKGLSKDELILHMERILERVRLRAIIGSLDNLKKGGRLSAASALIGSALKIKPIIEVNEGLVEVLHKARGEKNALKWLLEAFEAEADVSYPIVVGHSYCLEKCRILREEIESRSGSVDCFTELGAVVGTHAGEGCYGVAYIAK